MLVFAAIVPHCPILIPKIGRDKIEKIQATVTALELLEQEFIKSAPDIVIVLSSHGDIYPNTFTINSLPSYQAKFEDFGDFETQFEYQGALTFISRLKEQVEARFPLMLKSIPILDHSTSVPLYVLGKKCKDFYIVPVNYSFLSYQQHIVFGEELKEAIANSNKRIAVIASAQLSQKLLPQGVAGFSPRAKEFDKKIIQLLKQKKVDNIVNLDKQLIDEANETGLRSILILLGIVKELNYEFQVLNYESPFGIGYLVGEFKLA